MLPRCLGVGGARAYHTRVPLLIGMLKLSARAGCADARAVIWLLAAIAACPRGDKQQTKNPISAKANWHVALATANSMSFAGDPGECSLIPQKRTAKLK